MIGPIIFTIIFILLFIFCCIGSFRYDNKKNFYHGSKLYEVSFRSEGKGGWLHSKVIRLSDGKKSTKCDHEKKKYTEIISDKSLVINAAREAIDSFCNENNMKEFFKSDKYINL